MKIGDAKFGVSLVGTNHDRNLAVARGLTFRANRMQSTRIYDLRTFAPVSPVLEAGGDAILDVAISPKDKAVALAVAGNGGGQIRLRSLEGGVLAESKSAIAEPRAVCFRPDGSQLAAMFSNGEVLVLDPSTLQVQRRFTIGAPLFSIDPNEWVNNGRLSYSPDGTDLAAWGMTTEVCIWNAETGAELHSRLTHEAKIHDVKYSPDGRLIATSGYDRNVRVWRRSDGSLIAGPFKHPDNVFSAIFSPDCRGLATMCRDGQVRIWDWQRGELTTPPMLHPEEVLSGVFTSDGRHLITTCKDGKARFWDVEHGQPVAPPRSLLGIGLDVDLADRGSVCIVGGFTGQLHVFDLGDLSWVSKLSTDDICLLAEVIAGARVTDGNGLIRLTQEESHARWLRIRDNFEQVLSEADLQPSSLSHATNLSAPQSASE